MSLFTKIIDDNIILNDDLLYRKFNDDYNGITRTLFTKNRKFRLLYLNNLNLLHIRYSKGYDGLIIEFKNYD